MKKAPLSYCFNNNLFFYKILGLWAGRTPSKFYKYFSFLFLFISFFIYNILLTFNLYSTPRIIELYIREVIFYFTELALVGKIAMILFKRKQILEAFDLLDCEFFKGDDDISTKIVTNNVKKYLNCWKIYAIFCNVTYVCHNIAIPLILLMFGKEIDLPISKYYFLSDDIRDTYFMYWFFYQSIGMYIHLTYNINFDTFTGGLMFHTITQLKVINHKLNNVKLVTLERQKKKSVQEKIMRDKLLKCLKHYDVVLRYNSLVQEIISFAMFLQFGITSIIVCVVLCGLTIITSTTETMFFMIAYLLTILSEIFVPTWLGSQIRCENQALAFAAYNTDWIPRSEKFKRILRLFVERANSPMEFTGLKMFPLVLDTFTSIIKMSYSFFSLIRTMKDRQTQH